MAIFTQRPGFHHSTSFVIATDGVFEEVQKDRPKLHISSLGVNPLQEIASYLDPYDLARLEQVCKQTTSATTTTKSIQQRSLSSSSSSSINRFTDFTTHCWKKWQDLYQLNNAVANSDEKRIDLSSKFLVARYCVAQRYARQVEFTAACTYDYDTTTLREAWLLSRYKQLPDINTRAWKSNNSLYNKSVYDNDNDKLWQSCGSLHKGNFSIFVRISMHQTRESLEEFCNMYDKHCSTRTSDDTTANVIWQGYVPYRLYNVPPSALLVLDLKHLQHLSITPNQCSITAVIQPHNDKIPCSLLCASAGLCCTTPTATTLVPISSPELGQRRPRRHSRDWNVNEAVVVMRWRRVGSKLHGISLSLPNILNETEV